MPQVSVAGPLTERYLGNKLGFTQWKSRSARAGATVGKCGLHKSIDGGRLYAALVAALHARAIEVLAIPVASFLSETISAISPSNTCANRGLAANSSSGARLGREKHDRAAAKL
jgi:hypothetical protein